jgi:hypothetical protein
VELANTSPLLKTSRTRGRTKTWRVNINMTHIEKNKMTRIHRSIKEYFFILDASERTLIFVVNDYLVLKEF